MPSSTRDHEQKTIDDDGSRLQLRIDPAHAVGGARQDVDVVENEGNESDAVHVARAAALAGSVSARAREPRLASLDEQLEIQAEQIASHLRETQEHLDRREADLHAQLADQENDARGMRLWLRERQQEFATRESEVAARLQEIEIREAAVERAEREQAEAHERAKTDQRRQSEAFAARQRELDERQRALDRQDAEQAATAAALARLADEREQQARRLLEKEAVVDDRVCVAVDLIGRFLRGEEVPETASSPPANDDSAAAQVFNELATGLKRLRARQRNIEEAEALLDDGQAELDDARHRLEERQRAFDDRCRGRDQQFAQEKSQAEAEIEKKLLALRHRADEIERRSSAVDQLRAEVLRSERETLETRLATDEVWAQMMAVVPPAALSQSLAKNRAKLAGSYSLERQEIAGEKLELEKLIARLDDARQKAKHRQDEIERWSGARLADLEGQTARLAALEQELDRRQTELDDRDIALQQERQAYEAEIRRLLAKCRREDR